MLNCNRFIDSFALYMILWFSCPLKGEIYFMLFYLYLASVAVSAVIIHFINISFTERLKQDRIEVIKKASWNIEIAMLLFTFFKVCFPIFNLFYVLYMLCCYQSIYQRIVTKLFLQGKVIFNGEFLDGDNFLETRIY